MAETVSEGMTPERFQRIKELFESALELEADEQAAFLEEEVGDDRELYRAVEALLVQQRKADSFLERSPRLLGSEEEVDPLRGRELGPYRVLEMLGRGGMGIVYLAEDTRLERKVSLKALPLAFSGDAKREARLRLEAKAAASLSHPNIATVYTLEELEGRLFIVGEYIDGLSLRERLDHGPVDVKEALSVAESIGRGLEAAHAKGIIHRDLKPENIMRDMTGEVKILDFGLAALLGRMGDDSQRITEAGAIPGTPAYMSPEQLLGEPLDGRSDIFSFGVLLYELVSRKHPFLAENPFSTVARVMEGTPEPLATGNEKLEAVIGKCLEKHRDHRYESIGEVLSALKDMDRVPLEESRKSSLSTRVRSVGGRESLSSNWWTVHQFGVMLFYAAMVYPLWWVNEQLDSGVSLALFLVLLACAAAGGTWRAHLLFTARFNPPVLSRELLHARKWLRLTDGVFVTALLLAGFFILSLQPRIAGFLAAVACGYAVVFLVVEPATTRGVFGSDVKDSPR